MEQKKGKPTKDGHYDVDSEDIILEKNDMAALVLSGFLTIGLPCLILVMIIIGAVLLFFT